ncbi:MAG: cupin domain-containing protein [Gammaproteobacteria bacterium]
MNPRPLGNMPADQFLSEYWQKKPLLIRNALPDIKSPVDADVLAGLACEEAVESRLIIRQGEEWELQHGPFNDELFSTLPKENWTLLVQAVDQCIPKAADMLELFDFIPRWRIDDLMMSYANHGGGVGPHFDQYDVFLVQTSGQRKWEVGGTYDDTSSIRENLPVKILDHFVATESWVLNPGDILYLPPGIGHNGIAQGDGCITCSVGFRAPSHAEILRDYTDYIGDQLTESLRYQDLDLKKQVNSGEISTHTFEKIQQIVSTYTQDSEALRHWFAKYVTTPKYQQVNDIEHSESEQTYSIPQIKHHLASNHCLIRNEGSRFAFVTGSKDHMLFVDGQLIETNANCNELIELLCSKIKIQSKDFIQSENNFALLLTLLNHSSLYLTQ